ncbi:membrane-bound metal-dependent hydrolase [Erythrobacter sp. SG61-1L]|uniref:metal-dependent hydrolase n=1 Tax=Erythrobacter sp. SG61-1L TaxID=1603897 RepID=UPI0006C92693|nr:metal-dependent hydrolase [Erythrobacter sp. SG61-1L]KPL67791.1 membrane-bound metal-dependent hydrolase [Erythrobacter sp. SG61-1L]
MDNLTHSLVGALLGQAGLKRKTGLAMPALIVGANIPDIDATCTVYGIESLAMRRGLTHGPIAWVVLPLILAGLLWWYDRWQAKRGKRPERRLPVHFGWLYALSLIGCLTHPAMDWLNNYGIRLLEPFSHRWFYGDAIFIIDLWLWLGMGFAVWFSLRREKAGGHWRKPAQIALAMVLAYIGGNIAFSRFAAEQARLLEPYPAVAYVTPVPLAFWQRDVLAQGADGRWFRRRYPNGQVEWLEPATKCSWPDVERLTVNRPDLAAFLFWSRMPIVTPAADGKGIEFNDARFFDPLTRGRFAVEVPGVSCK